MNIKIILFFLAYFFVVAISMSIVDSIDEQWEQYKDEFNKTYKLEDEENKKQIFQQNVEKINRHNKRFANGDVLYKLGINQFADMSEDEILSLRDISDVLIYDDKMPSEYDPEIKIPAPSSHDWRKCRGVVSKIKDAGNCLKCDWAFTAVGALEGQLNMNAGPHNNITQLSEQELIECSGGWGNNGCNGGEVLNAFRYVKDEGISTESTYPLTATENECKNRISPRDGIPIGKKINYRLLMKGDEKDMKYRLYEKGPIVAEIYASLEFFLYEGGIFTGEDCNGTETNYNILVVGYDEIKPQEFWIAKNWHGEKWGENGYIRILRNNNTCGIANKTLYISNITSKIN